MWLGRHQLLPSGSLHIESVQSTDEGVYRCIAVNPVSSDRLSADNTVTLRTLPGQYGIPTTYYILLLLLLLLLLQVGISCSS